MKIGFINLLESSTVTVTSEASGYDGYRLYDRFLKRMWKATSVSAQTIKADQGASGSEEVNALIIPAGHNLDGVTIYFEYSTDDFSADINEAVSNWSQSGTGIIVKTFSPALTKRYWRVRLTGLSVVPEVGEIFITKLYEFTAQPLGPGLRFGKMRNVMRTISPSGVSSFNELGDARRIKEFVITNISSSELSDFQDWSDEWAGKKPFYVEDVEEEQYFAEIDGEFMFEAGAKHRLSMRTIEVL